MFDNSDTLERMISPLEMLERLRVPVRGGGGNYSATCPFCGADCWVNSNSFLCRNDLCVFLAGSVLDMAVGFSKPRNYVSAMQILRKHFGKVLDSEGLTERADVQLVDEARKRRRLMRAVRKMHQQQDINGQRAMLLASLQKQGIHDPGHHLFGVLLRSEQDWLRDLLLGLDMEVPELPDANLLTVPYWVDHHLLSALVLLDPRKRGEVLIEFHPAKLAFAGMHMITPDLKQLHLHDSPVNAGKANATRAQESGQAGVAFLLGKGERMSPAVPDMVLHWHSTMNPAVVTRLHNECPGLMFETTTGKTVTYDGLLYDTLKPCIKHGKLNRNGLSLLGHYNPQGIWRRRLLDRFKNGGHVTAWEQLNSQLFNVVIAETDRTTLLDTPAGYASRRAGGRAELFTNFTLRLVENVVFGAQDSTYHSTDIVINGTTKRVILPSDMLDSPRELLEHLQLHLAASSNMHVPMLRDTSSFRPVAFYLRGIVPKLPVVMGTPFLGWSHDKSTFHSPGCVIDADGGRRKSGPFHPALQILDIFNNQTCDPAWHEGLSEMSHTIMLIIIGGVMRAFRNELQPVTHVLHDNKGQAVLEAAMSALGQKRPMAKLQHNLTGVQGYPMWVQAARGDGRFRTPYVMLSDHGLNLNEVPDAELALLAPATRWLLLHTVEALMAHTDKWVKPAAVLHTNSLILEAHAFIRDHLGVRTSPRLASFDWVEHLLRRTPAHELPALLTYDFKPQTVTWHIERPDVDMVALELELRKLTTSVRVAPGGQDIVTDAASTMSLLETFYGELPALTVR